MTPDERDRLARLEERMKSAAADREEHRAMLNEMRGELREIRDTIVAARGGWKTMAAMGGFMLFIGAVLDRVMGLLAKAI